MKIYTLTIGIDEEAEEVEFIQEEQYEVKPNDVVVDPAAESAAEEEEDFHRWIKRLMIDRFNIIGRA